jgi:hypothetical protein
MQQHLCIVQRRPPPPPTTLLPHFLHQIFATLVKKTSSMALFPRAGKPKLNNTYVVMILTSRYMDILSVFLPVRLMWVISPFSRSVSTRSIRL